jgi:hypothetical protein
VLSPERASASRTASRPEQRWSGIHFRTADETGVAIGAKVANWALDHYFASTEYHESVPGERASFRPALA